MIPAVICPTHSRDPTNNSSGSRANLLCSPIKTPFRIVTTRYIIRVSDYFFIVTLFQARLGRPHTAARRIPCARLTAGDCVTSGVTRIPDNGEIFLLDVTEPKWIVPTAVSRTSQGASRPPPPTSSSQITTLRRYPRSASSIASPIYKFST